MNTDPAPVVDAAWGAADATCGAAPAAKGNGSFKVKATGKGKQRQLHERSMGNEVPRTVVMVRMSWATWTPVSKIRVAETRGWEQRSRVLC